LNCNNVNQAKAFNRNRSKQHTIRDINT